MLEVKIDPADVVAIPTDYNNAKMRICKYEVLGVVTTPFDPSECLRITNTNSSNQDNLEQEGERFISCCEEELCGCPLGCSCIDEGCCSSSYCDECEANEFNYDACDENIEHCTCECCACENCPKQCGDEPYPYEDELEDI